MSDFVSGFWSPYVTIATLAAIAFCLFLLIANSRKPPTFSPKNTHMPSSTTSVID